MWRNEWNNILFLSSFSLLFAVSPGTIEVAELVTNNKKMQHPDWLLPLSLWPVKFIHCCTVAQLTPPTFLLLFWLSPPPSLPSAVSAWCRGWGKRINTHTHTHIYRAMWVDAFTYTRARHRNSVASGFHKHLPRSGDLLSFIHWSFQDRFLVACLAFSVCLFSICFLFCNELELHHLTPSVCSANLIDWSLWF